MQLTGTLIAPITIILLDVVSALVFLLNDMMLRGTFVYNDSIPIGDWLDLIVVAPCFALGIVLIHFRYHDAHNNNMTQIDKILSISSVIGIILFFYGHAMHLVGNSIHTVFTEIRPNESKISKTALIQIYFWDETLGHWLFLVGWYTFLLSALLAQKSRRVLGVEIADFSPKLRNTLLSVASGVFTGIIHTIAFIEGDAPELGLVLAPLTLFTALFHGAQQRRAYEKQRQMEGTKKTEGDEQKKQHPLTSIEICHKSFLSVIHSYPVTTNCFYQGLTLVLMMTVYWIRFGEFVQPSHIGGVGCAFLGACSKAVYYPKEMLAQAQEDCTRLLPACERGCCFLGHR